MLSSIQAIPPALDIGREVGARSLFRRRRAAITGIGSIEQKVGPIKLHTSGDVLELLDTLHWILSRRDPY